MIGKLVLHSVFLVVLAIPAITGILTGLLAISDQFVDSASWHDEYSGRGAVFFGATCILVGLAFLFFYLSRLILSKVFIMIGISFLGSTLSISRVDQYIPDSLLNEEVVPRVQDMVNTHIRPILEMVGW